MPRFVPTSILARRDFFFPRAKSGIFSFAGLMGMLFDVFWVAAFVWKGIYKRSSRLDQTAPFTIFFSFLFIFSPPPFFFFSSSGQQVRAVFRLVEHLCPRLGASGLSVIYEHLRQLPRQYEEMHVHLIRHFAEAASGVGSRGGSGTGGAEKNAVSAGE